MAFCFPSVVPQKKVFAAVVFILLINYDGTPHADLYQKDAG
jgi:hypothetical protein